MEAGFVQAVGSIIPISLGGLLATANQESNQRNSFHQFFFGKIVQSEVKPAQLFLTFFCKMVCTNRILNTAFCLLKSKDACMAAAPDADPETAPRPTMFRHMIHI